MRSILAPDTTPPLVRSPATPFASLWTPVDKGPGNKDRLRPVVVFSTGADDRLNRWACGR